MDYLMKLVTTALEWTYSAGETDVRAETLEVAASLLVLRRDTLRLIDGAGPDIEAPHPRQSNGLEEASETEAEQPTLTPTGQVEQAQSRRSESPPKSEVQKAVLQPTQSTKCTFFGTVPIDLKRFQESGVSLARVPLADSAGSASWLGPSPSIIRKVSRRSTRSSAACSSVSARTSVS